MPNRTRVTFVISIVQRKIIWQFLLTYLPIINQIGGVIVNVLVSSAVDRGFERTGQIKVYIIGICCISTTHAPIKRKSQNQNNVL